jgi:PAS domain S-box-containing protein
MSGEPHKPKPAPPPSPVTPPPRVVSELGAIVASAPALIFLLDPAGRYLYASRAVNSASAEEVTGKLLEQVLAPQQAVHVRELMKQVQSSGRTRSVELGVQDAIGRPQGHVVTLSPFQVHGRVVGYVGVCLARPLQESSPTDAGAAALAARLTPKQREVLVLVAEGLSSREIGQRLGVSERTVETHRQQLMDRLDIRGVAALARFALSAGLL